jgi:pyrroline-5-carboxylate reductase
VKLGFIGTGKISSAVVEGLCRSDLEHLSIRLSPRNEQVSRTLAQTYADVERCTSNQQVLYESELVCLAVRPHDARPVLKDLTFREDHTVVSFVPFLPKADLAACVAPARQVCRAIPLPTVVHHQCPIPILDVTDTVMTLFAAIGQPLPVEDERQLHILWTLTGLISPFYDLLGQWSAWSMAQGVDQGLAHAFVADMAQALSFAAQQQAPIRFDALSHHAATPGGMNEQAAQEIMAAGSHTAYEQVLDRLLMRFPKA